MLLSRMFRNNSINIGPAISIRGVFSSISKDLFFTTKINTHRISLKNTATIDDNGVINVYIDYLEKSKALLEQTLKQINKIQLENK